MISNQEWHYWTRGRVDEPREIGIPRQLASGFNELVVRWKGTDEYAAIFSQQQIDKSEYDTILMDIDGHNGESWQDKARQVLAKCEPPPSRIYMTGRGAHFYWDLETPIVGTGRYKQVVTALVKKWGIGDLVDPRVVGDVRRMARLPMSQNSKGGYAIRVPQKAITGGLTDITIDFLGGGGIEDGEMETMTIEEPRKIELKIGEIKAEEPKFEPMAAARRLYEEGQYPPCIRIATSDMMRTGELDHAQRLHLFSFLVANDEREKGWTLLKDYAGDFNPSISEYQLNYIAKTGLKPFKCRNVPVDLCPYTEKRDCAFFPSINLHRARLLEQEARNGA